MYAGRMVEEAPVRELFARPLHPYTRGLLDSMPRLNPPGGDGNSRLCEIPGTTPAHDEAIPGCAFAPRCPRATARCGREAPALEEVGAGRRVACFEWKELAAA
jgi:oligopeptide/dipeptide ABC transporter ATP-binding protein